VQNSRGSRSRRRGKGTGPPRLGKTLKDSRPIVVVKKLPTATADLTPKQQAALNVLIQMLVQTVVKEITEEEKGEADISADTKVASQ